VSHIKSQHRHGTPRHTQSLIHESCPACIVGASGVQPWWWPDLRPGRQPPSCMRLWALRVVTCLGRSILPSPKAASGGGGGGGGGGDVRRWGAARVCVDRSPVHHTYAVLIHEHGTWCAIDTPHWSLKAYKGNVRFNDELRVTCTLSTWFSLKYCKFWKYTCFPKI